MLTIERRSTKSAEPLTRSLLRTLAEGLSGERGESWRSTARPNQLPPDGDWRIWLILAGRGWGKSRAINEFASEQSREMPGSRGAIIAATAADARDVVVEGESGILNISDESKRPVYEPSKRRLTWPNGTTATLFSADEPNRLRGPQFHWAIADELAHWRYMEEAWNMLMFGLRLGQNPRCAVATTPRPVKLLKQLMADKTVHVTRGSTYENRDNLAPAFFEQIIGRYEGTRLGRQEINAELLEDVPGALWTRTLLDDTRRSEHPALFRIVTAIDPHATTGETGIVTAGIGHVDGQTHLFVLSDVTRGGSPSEWATAAVSQYNKSQSDVLVGETNHGGDMIEHVIRTVPGGKNVRYKSVRATRGKYVRAEPVAALFEQGRAHMVGYFTDLEDELCSWVPGDDSPNRLDAMVWAAAELVPLDEPGTYDDIVDLGKVEDYSSPWA